MERLTKELARRRTFLFFFALFIVAVAGSPVSEPTPARRLGAYIQLFAIGVGIVVILVRWRSRGLRDLVMQNNIALGLVLVLAASLIVDFHFPTAVFAALLLINRFI